MISQSELARIWGVSKQRISYLVGRGLPLDSVESADAWRAATAQRSARSGNSQPKSHTVVDVGVPIEGETIEDTVVRVRQTEKALAIALKDATDRRDIALIAALRKEHATAVKILIDSEFRLLRLAQAHGKLVPVDVAKAQITAALSRVAECARRLPDAGTDDADKTRLDKVANEILTAMRAHGLA